MDWKISRWITVVLVAGIGVMGWFVVDRVWFTTAFERGETAFKAGRLDDGLRWFEQAAGEGDQAAMIALYRIYSDGKNLDFDLERARQYLLQFLAISDWHIYVLFESDLDEERLEEDIFAITPELHSYYHDNYEFLYTVMLMGGWLACHYLWHHPDLFYWQQEYFEHKEELQKIFWEIYYEFPEMQKEMSTKEVEQMFFDIEKPLEEWDWNKQSKECEK